jgi:hypothetical protein
LRRNASAPDEGHGGGQTKKTGVGVHRHSALGAAAGAAPAGFFGSTRTNVVAVHSAGNGIAGATVLRLDVNAAHVDDSRELADTLEEAAEVVIRPLDLQANGPLRVQLPRRNRLRREAANCEIGLRGHPLDPP